MIVSLIGSDFNRDEVLGRCGRTFLGRIDRRGGKIPPLEKASPSGSSPDRKGSEGTAGLFLPACLHS